MRFADELRGSEGEPCTVTDLRTGTVHVGTVEAVEEAVEERDSKVIVRYVDGTRVRVGYSFVTLTNPETI